MIKNDVATLNVLVVDDEEVVLSLIRDALEDGGFKVDTASNGIDALKIIESRKFELIITDIRMPKMDGIELVRCVREKYPNVAVIFTTGYADVDSAKEAIQYGATDYIFKPFELHEIRAAVAKAVERIRKTDSSDTPDQQLEHLSDLGQMLFTAGDKKSLITTSLKFTLRHCRAESGSVLYWDSNRTDFNLVFVRGDETIEQKVPDQLVLRSLDKIDLKTFRQPKIINHIDEHPLYQATQDQRLLSFLCPDRKRKKEPMIIVPITRNLAIYGLLMINISNEAGPMNEANLKFLAVSTQQLAMSLVNLELLEESQKAYARLKELQDETIQLEKMAARGEMSAEIGHELNNFVGVVAGNLSLLEFQLHRHNYNDLDKYLEAMKDNIEKITAFTGNLMDMQLISSKKQVIYFDQVIKEVIEYLKPQSRFHGVVIDLQPVTDSLPLEADAVHIQQLLYNLFNNAADAMALAARRNISVKVGANPDSKTFRLIIADTGVGMPPEQLDRAFRERFTTKPKGHGFGLLVCKRIIDSHQGKLTVDSVPGEGTTIIIDFPLKKVTKIDSRYDYDVSTRVIPTAW